MVLGVVTAASAQPADPPLEVTTVVVPVVGSVIGATGVLWKTDLELHNDQPAELNVLLSLPAAGGERWQMVAIPPGESVRYVDVVGQAFGIDAALSPLVVQTEGRRSVAIRATAYGMRGAEVSPPQPIAVNYGPTYYPLRILQNLSFNDEFRTNIGLANLSERSAEFILALQRVPGRNLAVNRVTLPPNALWHTAIQSMFPMITSGDHFSVVVETPSPATYVYASVIENTTNRALFIPPMITVSSARR
jgi:hypothetical protein